MSTSITNVTEDGLEVSLDNGSVWTINTGDSTKSACWYPTQRIETEKHKEFTYLINLDTAGPDRVRASRLL